MRTIFIFGILFLFVSFSIGQNVMFLHHSTGAYLLMQGNVRNWITDYNSNNNTDYQLFDSYYPNSPYPWANYPYDYWNLWINNACDNTDPDIICMDLLTQNYDVIIFKHCFPGAHIVGAIEPPSISSSTKMIENYKLQYRALRSLMDSYPNDKFIVWTLAPLHRLATTADHAARAREFVNWVKSSWLTEDGKTHANIYIFDFYGYAAENNPNPVNGQVNCLKYEYERSHDDEDSHPNELANQIIGPEFAQFIVNTIESTSGSEDTTPPSIPSGLGLISNSETSVSFSWNASTDNVGVTGYRIFRDGTSLGTTSGLTYIDNSVDACSDYSYTVSAYDAAGNESAQSSGIAANTDIAAPEGTITQPTCTTRSGTVEITFPTGSNIEYSIDGGSSWSSGTSFLGLTAGATYNISVRNTTADPSCISSNNFTINEAPPIPSPPVVSNSQPENICPSETVDLTGLVTSTTPAGGSIFYKTTNNAEGTEVADPTAVGAGSYYLFYQNQEGCYSTGTEIIVTINSCSTEAPDITPTLIVSPNIMHGITNFDLIVRVTELKMMNTSGIITVNIPKESRWFLPDGFVPSLTVLGTTELNNSEWAYDSDATNHIFTSSTAIPAGGSSTFGFMVTFDPGGATGVYTITSQIESGGGGELKVSNNADSEKIDYFQE